MRFATQTKRSGSTRHAISSARGANKKHIPCRCARSRSEQVFGMNDVWRLLSKLLAEVREIKFCLKRR